jgi:hypothetical protein
MKTTGLDIMTALDLANMFCCDLKNNKSENYYNYDDLPYAHFNYDEVIFHEWELKNLQFHNLQSAIKAAINGSRVYAVEDKSYMEVHMVDGLLMTKTGDCVRMSEKLYNTVFIIV